MKKEINDLQNEIADLKSQLANIKYLSEYEIDKAIFGQMDYDEYGNIIDFNANKAAQAICNLAIDIDRDKIIEVLREHNYKINEINMTMINDDNWLLDEEKIANKIISKMDWQIIGRLSGDQFEYLSFEKNKGRDFIKTRKYPKIITVEIAVREIKQNS